MRSASSFHTHRAKGGDESPSATFSQAFQGMVDVARIRVATSLASSGAKGSFAIKRSVHPAVTGVGRSVSVSKPAEHDSRDPDQKIRGTRG